jgi:HK97 gp10 family phage protein
MKVTVSVTGIKEVQEKLHQVNKDINGPGMLGAMSKAVTIVETSAKRYAPVDRGQLRASITSTVGTTSNSLVGVVGSNVRHAPYQETGTRPFWPPLAPLIEWVHRKFHLSGSDAFGAARGIQRKIARTGIKGKQYLQKAFTDNERKIEDLFENATNDIVEK